MKPIKLLDTSSRGRNLLLWGSALLVIVLATVVYQPAAAKTGALLIWTNNKLAIMDIDTLTLTQVGPASAEAVMLPSPACYGLVDQPCRVVADAVIYTIELSPIRPANVSQALPIEEGYAWINDAALSWSPDGRWLAYPVWNTAEKRADLRVFNASTGETKPIAEEIAPHVAPAWTSACIDGLEAKDCMLAYKKHWMDIGGDEFFPGLVAVEFATGQEKRWEISTKPVYALRWTRDNRLLFSRPKHKFRFADNLTPVYPLPAAAKLANTSPTGEYVVFYQPFRVKDGCTEGATDSEACLYLGVWLGRIDTPEERPQLIYNVKLSEQQGGLNFVPVWAPHGNAFVFIQDSRLVYYNIVQNQATIWYKGIAGKLRSLPVFSPNEEAVAFVDDQGRGLSEFRLVVVNPRLKPVEHIIDAKSGFRVLAWLPF